MYILDQNEWEILNLDKVEEITYENYEIEARVRNVIHILGEYDDCEAVLRWIAGEMEKGVNLIRMPKEKRNGQH